MQISLVWNARDEDSVQSEKLHKMAEVIQDSNYGSQCPSHNNIILKPILLCILSVLQVASSSQELFFISPLSPFQMLWRKGNPKSVTPILHSVWANFQTSKTNVRIPVLTLPLFNRLYKTWIQSDTLIYIILIFLWVCTNWHVSFIRR